MKIAGYLADKRSLYIQDVDWRDFIEDPWLVRGEKKYCLRDLMDAATTAEIDSLEGLVFYSSNESVEAVPEVRHGSWLYFNVGSAEDFLDDFQADWRLPGDEVWIRASLRSLAEVGVITGPVDRIVITWWETEEST
jgi:hypothetical protein